MKWSPERAKAVSVKTHGIIHGRVENVESAASIYKHFAQPYRTNYRVDDKRVSTRLRIVLGVVGLIEGNEMIVLVDESQGRLSGI
jgi:hypothetical protein